MCIITFPTFSINISGICSFLEPSPTDLNKGDLLWKPGKNHKMSDNSGKHYIYTENIKLNFCKEMMSFDSHSENVLPVQANPSSNTPQRAPSKGISYCIY